MQLKQNEEITWPNMNRTPAQNIRRLSITRLKHRCSILCAFLAKTN